MLLFLFISMTNLRDNSARPSINHKSKKTKRETTFRTYCMTLPLASLDDRELKESEGDAVQVPFTCTNYK